MAMCRVAGLCCFAAVVLRASADSKRAQKLSRGKRANVLGDLNRAILVGETIVVQGWACQPGTGQHVNVHLYLDGQVSIES